MIPLAVSFLLSVAVATAGFWLGAFTGAGQVDAFVTLGLVLTLPHVMIGDTFHWRRFPALAGAEKARWLLLAAGGLLVFLVIRHAGPYKFPLFYAYFLGHFWKDLDLCLGGEEAGGVPRRLKRAGTLVILVSYIVIASGLVQDPRLIAGGKIAAWGALLAVAFAAWRRPERAAATYVALTAAFLVVFTWVDATHPARRVVPTFLVVWHFMIWYTIFYWWHATGRLSGRDGGEAVSVWEALQRSLPAFTTLILAVNLACLGGAWLHAMRPEVRWLTYLYDFDFVAGGWTTMHVTWDWLPKRVRGLRLSLL
jgi:hypothetical protein